MRKKRFWIFVPLGLAAIAAFGLIVMLLWNALMPELFGLKEVSYQQAWGMILLAKLLFGGFRGTSGPGWNWRHRMMQRCERMTPEEREKFRQAFESRWGRGVASESTPAA